MPPLIAAAAAAASTVSLGAVATQFALGVGLSLIGQVVAGTETERATVKAGEIAIPSSRPPKRFNYGLRKVSGSPMWRVKGSGLYGCLILNSGPSVGPFSIVIDKRETTLDAGDPYDFAGAGQRVLTPSVLNDVFRFWIGRGEQTAPPADILAEAPDLFDATDGWRGRTVLWVRCMSGGNRQRLRRWPRTPPDFEVRGRWSPVWDPRDPAQSPGNPATWQYSANHALCILHALMHNPIRAYRRSQLLIDTFVEAANIADQNIQRIFPPGTDDRYRVHGQIVWKDGEVEQQIEPLFAAGASRPIWIGGRLGIAPGAYQAPIYTVRDVLAPLEFVRWAPGRDLATTAQMSFVDTDGDEQLTPLPAYEVPGARVLDGGEEKVVTGDLEFVIHSSQGQRVQKIKAHRGRAQKVIRTVLPPDAFDLVAGSTVVVDLPSPYSGMNGIYEAQEVNPGLSLQGDGVAMQIGVELLEIGPSDFAWNPAAEERELAAEDFDAQQPELRQGGVITAAVGPSVAQDTGGAPINRIRFLFDPSPSASADGYEWEFRRGSDDWEGGGFLDGETLTSGGKVRGYLSFVKSGDIYAIRVRATAGDQASAWRSLTGIVAGSAT